MSGDESNFPLISSSEIVLSGEYKRDALKEAIVIDVIEELSRLSYTSICTYMPSRHVLDAVAQRYKFSQYVIDPKRFRFRKVVRVLALVYLFANNLLVKINRSQPIIARNGVNQIPNMLAYQWDKYLVTTLRLCLCTVQVSRVSRISRMLTSYSYITPLRCYLSWYLGGVGAYTYYI